MSAPLVTVIIPTCGRAHLIGEAIESALDQRGLARRPEVLVVDDGAEDDSAARAAAFDGVRVLFQGERTGISRARNRALAEARGALVVFLDDDDRLLPDAVRAHLRVLEGRPELGMTFGRARLVDASGAPNGVTDPVVCDGFADVLRGRYPVHPAAALARRAAVLDVGAFDPRRGIAQDYDLWTRLARRHGVRAHDEVVSDYRTHPDNVRRQRGPAACLQAVNAILDDRRALLRDDDERRAWAEARAHWRGLFGPALPWEVVVHLRAGQLHEAWTALAVTLRHAPPGTLARFGGEALGRFARRAREELPPRRAAA
ncbi:MAG: glycosyltransferase [Planctomycetes bacterium]|nr:glycosyltransferase [Planctomycetota bacterium]